MKDDKELEQKKLAFVLYKDRGYENLERQGLADKHTGSVQPPFSDGIGEVERKYEKSSTREHSASEVTSRRQSAVDDLSKSERFQADNIVRRPISQMPASHTASNQYPGLDGDSHQPSEAKTMTHPNQAEIDCCFKNLLAEIAEVKPKVVILLGEKVCSAVEKKLDIKLKRWRGFEYFATEHNGIWYLPVQHPSYIYVYKRKEAEKYVEKIAEAIGKAVDEVK